MGRMFVKPLWNVRGDYQPEKTTLAVESVERRFSTGRGYCVTADSEKEARSIVFSYQRERKHNQSGSDCVQLIVHRGVPVLMAAPRW